MSGVPISNGYYYYWNDINKDHFVQPNEVLFDQGVYGFYNDIDPADAAEHPERDPAELQGARRPTSSRSASTTSSPTTSRVSATFTYRNTNNLIQCCRSGVTSLDDWALAGRTQCEDDNGNLGPRDRPPTASRSLIDEPVLRPAASRGTVRRHDFRTVPGLRRSTTASTSRSSNDCRTTGCCEATSAGTASAVPDERHRSRIRTTSGTSAARTAARPQTSCLATGWSSNRDSVFLNGTGSSTSTRSTRGPGESISAPTSSAARAIPNPYYVRIAASRHHRHRATRISFRSTRSTLSATTTSTSSISGWRRRSRSGPSSSPRRPSSSTWPTRIRSFSATSGLGNYRTSSGDVHPEQLLQPDHRGPESAHPEARHQRQLLGPRHSGARPGIPGGPFRFGAGVKQRILGGRDLRGPRPAARVVPPGGARPAPARSGRSARDPRRRRHHDRHAAGRCRRLRRQSARDHTEPRPVRGRRPGVRSGALAQRDHPSLAHEHPDRDCFPTSTACGRTRASASRPGSRRRPGGSRPGATPRAPSSRPTCSTRATASATTSTSTTSSTGTSTSSSSSTSSRPAPRTS